MPKPTYEKFDYRLRPAKNVERKMLAEAWTRLDSLHAIEKYRYVGMGSMFFNDFVLVHRRLGIRDMVSIEQDADKEERFRFNAPLDCIDVLIGTVAARLPELELESGPPAIVWLDYESHLNTSILSDVREACSTLPRKSLLLVTYECAHSKIDEDLPAEERGREVRTRLEKSVESSRVPRLDDHEYAGWHSASITRDILTAEIEETLAIRNGGVAKRDQVRWRQVHHFAYADGRPMVSVGGVLATSSDDKALKQSRIRELGHAQTGREPYFIRVPILTQREVLGLLKNLPTPRANGDCDLQSPGLDREMCEDFGRIYAMYPLFTETEFM